MCLRDDESELERLQSDVDSPQSRSVVDSNLKISLSEAKVRDFKSKSGGSRFEFSFQVDASRLDISK